MTKRLKFIAVLALALGAMWALNPKPQHVGADSPPGRSTTVVRDFLQSHCYACHDSRAKKGDLDLSSLKSDLDDARNFARWVKAHDRVRDGEMPPKGMPQPDEATRAAFLKALAEPMIAADDARARREGRATWRRMNRYEYENTLRDLLGAPWLQVKELLPEDGEAFRFNKVGEALEVSHVQMSRYLAAAEYALREVMAPDATRLPTRTTRYYAREQSSFASRCVLEWFKSDPERRTYPILGEQPDFEWLESKVPLAAGAAKPERRELEAMGVVASTYEPLDVNFDGFKASVSGRYKLRMMAHSFWAGPVSEEKWWRPTPGKIVAGRTEEPVVLYAETPPNAFRKLGSFTARPQPSVNELEVYLLKGETIRPDAARLFRSRPPNWRNPLARKDGQPGVAFRWLEVEGPIFDEWPSRGHRLMFGDLPIKKSAKGAPESSVAIVSQNPHADAGRLLRGFVQRAYRRPVVEADLREFVRLADTAMKSGVGFAGAMMAAYCAVLCSPEFVTLEEKPGRLDDYALSARLAYFLWNSEPDETLRELASHGALRNPAVPRAQGERMLGDAKAERFVEAFLDYWLDLRKVNNTSPDEWLYSDYYLDDFLVESARDETRRFFAEMLRGDLPARNLVASDFVMINERLASHYGLPGVEGAAIRRVALPPDSVRGGLLTQASVLKVTANGTTTSPVLRGVWIMERILGKPVPPPPASVPAVEPDTRGATTIRQQLDKHRTQASCNVCHAKIDPAGFALENFDVFGGWRDRYRALGEGEKAPGIGKNGQQFAFRYAQPVDASGSLPDGRHFNDVRELKRLLLADERQIARNLVCQLVTYATGAPVRFGDRPRVEAILDRAAPHGYGVKSLIQAIIESELFQNK